ncbi:Predicted phosphoglycerate mutase [Plasmopara halstedii]|uniref:Predicted phosphoglycerate mutase n=1 Tax=Plasmopara halstedii TaxID=4781 RepID=A0A0P1AI53_PLAHL|nr:Predicted phosphoglycerate mutase [Plasmopara halstedii]CEG40202.1 Predicted phosphoglycerate mutase [Plasmopara halstedii]|eukprot:XP_024576571.1 Predicted phosphoglycerate mutase [Plasmopara halstedii]
MSETTEYHADSIKNWTNARTAVTSVQTIEGFFEPKTPIDSLDLDSVPFFRRFQLTSRSWKEFQLQLNQLENNETNVARQVKVVYLVRHAEGIHNAASNQFGVERWEAELAFQDSYLDSDLTPFGVQDAKSRGTSSVKAELEKGMPRIERVVVSPLSRAIQTAQHFFDKKQLLNSTFVCMEKCREVFGCHTCDKRRSVLELKQKFPDVDFSAIKDENDILWTSTHRETDEEIQTRAKLFLVELFETIAERNVAVVTHSGFVEAVCAVVLGIRIHPANCEVIPLVLEAI